MIPNIPDTPQLFAESTWITPLIIFGLYLLASVISLLSFRIVRLILRVARFVSRKQQHIDPDHDRKISLLSGLIRLIAYILATLGSVSLFVDSASLVWFVGLFSAGFGIAARPIISDYLTGISLIFEGPFEVGEKVELPGVLGGSVEGVVEKIRLRTTTIRARSGEPIIVPNGEVRAIRNFSR
ncbi:MAG: small-conductance mechanosensitive channel, partial [Cellvibrionaceae bacterium]